LSYFFSGPIAQAYGWRAAMVLAALPAVILIPLLLRLSEPPRGPVHERAGMLAILRIPTMWWIIASGALLNFNMYAVATFLPAFLSRIHGLTLARSGIATGAVFAIGGLAGGLVAGRLGDHVIRTRPNGRLLMAAIFALAAAPSAFFGISASATFSAMALITA